MKEALERFFKIAATRSLIQIIVTAVVSVIGTLFVQQVTFEKAKIQTLQAEQRAAFIEVWSAEEKYALSLEYLQERTNITKFAEKFSSSNPVAQIVINNFQQAMQRSEQLREEATALLKTKQILMSESQSQLTSNFLKILTYDRNEDQPGRELREKNIQELRRQAKEMLSSI